MATETLSHITSTMDCAEDDAEQWKHLQLWKSSSILVVTVYLVTIVIGYIGIEN